MMTSNDKKEPMIKEKSNVSAVWLVPVIALIFGAYLGFKAYMDMGVMINLKVPDMVGIISGKTEIKYKGLVVGIVNKGQTMSDNLESVNLNIEMIPQASVYLNEETLFWLVKPEITLGGVVGLDTLLSGNYIAIRPGKDTSLPQQLEFTLLNETPAIASDTPGLHITLTTKTLGSIGIGTQVFHHKIPVGKVTSYRFNAENLIEIGVLIRPKYNHLINQNTRFWNASGIEIEGGVSGFSVNIESVASLIAGGIAFDTPEYLDVVGPVKNFSRFSLFTDYKSAKVTIKATLILPFDADIKESTQIKVKGIEVGIIKDLNFDKEKKKIIASVELNPKIQPMLNSNTVFFMVSPNVSLAGISNLETVVTGQYISVMPSWTGEPQDTFDVAMSPPPLNHDYPGLHLTLTSQDAGSVSYGDPVLYKNMVVGDVQGVKLLSNGYQFHISIHIKSKYSYLVTKKSKFWNAGGLKIKGSATGVEVQMESIETVLVGGIAFTNEDAKVALTGNIKNGEILELYPNKDAAIYTQKFSVEFNSRDDVIEGETNIILNNKAIGKVVRVDTDFRQDKLIATLRIKKNMAWLLNRGTRFWLVKPSLTSTSLGQLISGTYINVAAGFSHHKKEVFIAEKIARADSRRTPGLQLKLITKGKTSASIGSGVFYRNISIGYVSAVKLNKVDDNIEVAVTIDKEYQSLVSSHSRFYEASGLEIKINTQGVNIRTESLSSIIAGGIALYQPDEQGVKIAENTHFSLYKSYDEAQHAGLPIKIYFSAADGLFEGMSIKYQQQDVGVIKRIRFNKQLQGVTVDAQLYEEAQHLATTKTQIWKVEPSIGLVGNKNLESLFSSYLAIAGANGKSTTEFTAIDYQPPVKSLPTGLNIILIARKLGSVRNGNPILFRQVKVGQVIGTELNPDSLEISIFINIQQKYGKLITDSSVFWNASGLRIDAGIFSGLDIDTESIETLVAGGIAFANPPKTSMLNVGHRKSGFALHDKAKSKWLKW